MKKYKLQEKIGDGTYGTVWKGTFIETGESVAIKKLKNKIKSWQECMELNEVKILSKLKSHSNIIKLKEIIRESNSEVFMIFEYADQNLFQYMENIKKRGETISEKKIKEIVYQITCGIQYTHQNGFFHRDLKPENILMMFDTINNGEDYIKIADFGLARELPTYYHNAYLTEYVCTRWYRPPECILKSTNYSSSMDIWAIGCIMAELYLLSPLFPGISEMDQLTKVGNILGVPKLNDWPEGFKLIQKMGLKFPNSIGVNLATIIPNASKEAIDLLNELLKWDGLNRPNCTKILAAPYFDEIRSNKNCKYLDFNVNNTINTLYPFSNTNSNSTVYNNVTKNNFNSDYTTINYAYNNVQNLLKQKISSNSFNDQYIYKENYFNNFNFKNYRNNQNHIPDINSYNANINNLFLNNFNQNNKQQSKFSSLANNFDSDVNIYNNNFGQNKTYYTINNIYDQIIQGSRNTQINELQDNYYNNVHNHNYIPSKNLSNFREKENFITLNNNQTNFYPY